MIPMFRRLALALLLSSAAMASASAQTNLRVGLAEDPDVLDPSLARTYVGRIVFASICDKLFDIDENLKIVPQLALSYETSADGKTVTIKLRPGVKFHDGEPFDAKAAKYSLDRHLTLKTSVRKAEMSSIDNVEVVDPLTIKLNLKEPFSPLMAQLTDRAGMMVSPKAAEAEGDKFGLHPVCAVPASSSSVCNRTASSSRSSPTTGTRTRSSSTRSPTCRSSTARCGWPTCARAGST